MEDLLAYVIFGFIAQLIDGSLGMAFGVTLTTLLLTLGLAPAVASASVHTAEVFVCGASGLSHLRMGNVDYKLFKRLLVPGVVGGIIGAYVLTAAPGDLVKPFISAYLFAAGLMLLVKSMRKLKEAVVETRVKPLAFLGGFLDAIGGGGWGPIVTSTLIVRGNNPKLTVGSVNAAEFFVTLAMSTTFLLTMGLTHWHVIIGLIIGGVLAAPVAAYICSRMPSKLLMALVGTLIIVLSLNVLYHSVQ